MFKTQRIHIVKEFDFPVSQLFALLSEHENLSTIFFPVKVQRLNDGTTSRNGVGSARKLSLPPAPPFVETTLVYEENKLIEYAITSGKLPIKNHRGVMKFTDLGSRSKLDYTIEFKGRIPLVGLITKLALQNGIKNGLKKLKP